MRVGELHSLCGSQVDSLAPSRVLPTLSACHRRPVDGGRGQVTFDKERTRALAYQEGLSDGVRCVAAADLRQRLLAAEARSDRQRERRAVPGTALASTTRLHAAKFVEHVSRFLESARLMQLDSPFDRAGWTAPCHETVDRNRAALAALPVGDA